MENMAKVIGRLQACIFCVCALCLCLSCARSEPSQPPDAVSPASGKELPFHPGIEQTPARNTGLSDVSSDAKTASNLPFRGSSHPRIVPSGTLLTVQLVNSLSSSGVHAGDGFAAIVAAPLMIDGDTLIQRGSRVTGRIESAQSQPGFPGLVPGSGYFRLTLSEITVEGSPISLQTSSLFARGTIQGSPGLRNASAASNRSEGIRVQKGQPLTFRLTAPIRIGDLDSAAAR
jgi:hypothetical protein